ncbi:MAG: hypothetical protein JXR46_14680 [Calditrichaceae bacterium]|nr:hypothetical protein [Calditrichaceae bacterium]MBN2710286.1 hypothetical protein [Calditrichaceae bacterium]RQV93905.1 MAG: hypothetical protein EH224_11815 [Calditrichota bacterium]
MKDRVTEISLKYINSIRERLYIEINEMGQPVFFPGRINKFSLERLKNEIDEIYSSSLLDDALTDTASFTRDKKLIQTVGYGLVSDFQKLIKLGFLIGDRVVIWDFLFSRALSEIKDDYKYFDFIGTLACDLLLLESIINEGSIVILPPPIIWYPQTRKIFENTDTGKLSNADFALMSVLSIVDDFTLHPYTYFDKEIPKFPKIDTDYYNKEQFQLHNSLAKLFNDGNFAFLDGISTASFYSVIRQEKRFAEKLRELFNPKINQSNEQSENNYSHIVYELEKLKNERNKSLISHSFVLKGAIISMVNTAATLIYAGISQKNPEFLLSISALSGPLMSVIGRFLSKPSIPILIHVFNQLEKKYEDELVNSYLTNSYLGS